MINHAFAVSKVYTIWLRRFDLKCYKEHALALWTAHYSYMKKRKKKLRVNMYE